MESHVTPDLRDLWSAGNVQGEYMDGMAKKREKKNGHSRGVITGMHVPRACGSESNNTFSSGSSLPRFQARGDLGIGGRCLPW